MLPEFQPARHPCRIRVATGFEHLPKQRRPKHPVDGQAIRIEAQRPRPFVDALPFPFFRSPGWPRRLPDSPRAPGTECHSGFWWWSYRMHRRTGNTECSIREPSSRNARFPYDVAMATSTPLAVSVSRTTLIPFSMAVRVEYCKEFPPVWAPEFIPPRAHRFSLMPQSERRHRFRKLVLCRSA